MRYLLSLFIYLFSLFFMHIPEVAAQQNCEPECGNFLYQNQEARYPGYFLDSPPQHCFSIGPEIYYLRRNKKGGTKQNGVLYGLRGGYDRIKRYRLYWGVEGCYARGRLEGRSSAGDKLVSQLTDSEIEGRIGYTFNRKTGFCAWFIPFVGVGYFRQTNHFKHPSPLHIHFIDTFKYVVGGFLSSVCITPCLSVGLNFKFKYTWDGKNKTTHDPTYEDSSMPMSNKDQYSFDFPIRYLFCWCHRTIDLSFVPFYQFRHYGGRQNFPFDFIDTKFNVYGGRILLNFCF